MDSYMMPHTARQIITGQCYVILQIHTRCYTQQYLANMFQQQCFQVSFAGCLGRISFRSVNILRFCTVFLSLSRQVQGQYLKSNHSHNHILAISITLQPFSYTPSVPNIRTSSSLTHQVYRTSEHQDLFHSKYTEHQNIKFCRRLEAAAGVDWADIVNYRTYCCLVMITFIPNI